MKGIRAVAALLALAGIAVGADPPPAADVPPAASSLEVELLAGAWLPRLNGDASLGPGAPDIDLDDSLSLNDQEPTLNAELTIRAKEIWAVILSGFDYSTESTGLFAGNAFFGNVVLNNGDPYEAEFDITSVAAEVAVTVYRPFADGSPRVQGMDNRTADGRYIVDVRISPMFGLRYLDIDQKLTASGVRETTGGEWLAVLLGADFTLEYRPEERLPFLDMFGLQASLSVGPAFGGDDGVAWQVRGGLTFQFTENVGVLIGYRLVELDVENDDYSLDGGLQGLYFAGSIRF
ncbi:MAG: hypothetical protein ACYS15_17560 [Planctomycetota bacterium]|jgi:hypothetical protein